MDKEPMPFAALIERIRPMVDAGATAVTVPMSNGTGLHGDGDETSSTVESAALRHVLFASVCDGRRRATVVHASGDDLATCWKRVATKAAQAVAARRMDVRWLRIDWVTRAVPLAIRELKQQLATTKRNYFRHGLALDAHMRFALLEQELNANAVFYGGSEVQHAVLNEHNLGIYLQARYRREWSRNGGAEFGLDDDRMVYRLDTAGAFCSVDEPAPVALLPTGPHAGRRDFTPLDAGRVERLVDDGSRYLASQVQPDGRFHYGWHPCFDRPIPTYNSLRHASSVYAMIEAWEVTRRPELEQAIERALGYLTGTLIRTPGSDGGADEAYLVDTGNEIKLGGNAVCLLALCKYTEVTGDGRYLPLLDRLGRGILRMQDPASGRFVHVLRFPDLAVKEPFRIIYYDGEAAFGLMRLYGLTGNPRWLQAVERAFEHFIAAEHWRAHDHWLGYCVNELTRYREDPRYYEFGLRNVADYLDFVRNRITTFPTLLELMNAAGSMVSRLQRSPEMRHLLEMIDLPKFHRATERRAERLLDGHFWPEYAMYFRNPGRIVGSFFIRHHAFRVRIDDVEHYLSGLVGYRKYLLGARP